MAERTREYIYGLNPSFEVIRGGRRRIMAAYLNQAAADQPRVKKLVDCLAKNNIEINWVDKNRCLELSESKENQGVVLKTSTYPYIPSKQLIGRERLLLLDNVEDPHNVGAILRSAEVFGFQSVLLPTRGVPDIYPSIVKVSAGATEYLDIAKDKSANNYVKEALDEGYHIMVLDAGGNIELDALPPLAGQKLLVVIGGEDKSVGQYIINCAHYIVRIQQYGRVNSLNASVAAGISMFAIGSKLKKQSK